MTFDLEAAKASFLNEKSKFWKFRWVALIPRALRNGRVMPPRSKKLESTISLQGNLGVLLLNQAVFFLFVQIHLGVEQLAQKGKIAGPVLINGQFCLISREPPSACVCA